MIDGKKIATPSEPGQQEVFDNQRSEIDGDDKIDVVMTLFMVRQFGQSTSGEAKTQLSEWVNRSNILKDNSIAEVRAVFDAFQNGQSGSETIVDLANKALKILGVE